VKISGWNGKVYLLTDKAMCFDKNEIISSSTIDPKDLHIISLTEHFDSLNYGLNSAMNIDLRRNRKKSFRVKTQLFDFVNDSNIKIIAYADCDILFGRPDCAQSFIGAAKLWAKSGELGIKVTTRYNRPDGSMTGIHAGTLLMHRDYSQEALRLWREQMDRETEV
jgi:hypothetical protein